MEATTPTNQGAAAMRIEVTPASPTYGELSAVLAAFGFVADIDSAAGPHVAQFGSWCNAQGVMLFERETDGAEANAFWLATEYPLTGLEPEDGGTDDDIRVLGLTVINTGDDAVILATGGAILPVLGLAARTDLR